MSIFVPQQAGTLHTVAAKYFGLYRNKRVEAIAEIEGLVDVDSDNREAQLIWKNVAEIKDSDLRARAIQSVKRWRPDSGPVRVLALGICSRPISSRIRQVG